MINSADAASDQCKSSNTATLGLARHLASACFTAQLPEQLGDFHQAGSSNRVADTGYLIGEEQTGMRSMFTMMNSARLGVGLEGVSVAERSYQQAVEFAKERLQGTRSDGTRYPIIKFPDVRRMLMLMKAGTEAMRGLAYVAGAETDLEHFAKSPEQARKHALRTGLYTPIVKGWMTELAQELTYHGTQIHGGMGYVEETGAAQHMRDARILPIYEGTTGIQALDFAGRKMVALSESGTLPDPAVSTDFGVWWSWVSVWVTHPTSSGVSGFP